MDKYDHNAHSVFLLYYHLILVVKYRRKVIDDEISQRARDIFSYIAPNYGITLEEWNHDIDHVHIMFISCSYHVHIMFISCSVRSPEVRSVSSSMFIRVQAAA